MSAPARFDGLARLYRPLEVLAFGRHLERARFCLLDELADRRSILVLGEGDGRCLARLVTRAPHARIHCLDASPAMLRRAAARVGAADAIARVTFECTDARSRIFPPDAYDAVVTLFFLDCFDPAAVNGIVRRVRPAARDGALWLFADFALPAGGLARWRARLWLAVLYAFFRWQTGLPVRALPPSEELIGFAGFTPVRVREFQHGLIRTVLFRGIRPGS